MRCGNPVKYSPMGSGNDISFDEMKMSKMLGALSGVHLPMIEKMDPQDWVECGWGVARFFIPCALKDVMRVCLSLAEYYHRDPFDFLDREPEEVMNLFHETQVWIRERKLD